MEGHPRPNDMNRYLLKRPLPKAVLEGLLRANEVYYLAHQLH